MRLLILVFILALATAAAVPNVPHVPMQVVAPVAEFEVPWWLGGYVATTNTSSNWMLPLTYLNGGRTNAGTTLVIQNRGSYNITLYAQTPETIQELPSYLIVADSTVTFLSAGNWIVVSSTFGDEGTDGNFDYLQASRGFFGDISYMPPETSGRPLVASSYQASGAATQTVYVYNDLPNVTTRSANFYAVNTGTVTGQYRMVGLIGTVTWGSANTSGSVENPNAVGGSMFGINLSDNFTGAIGAVAGLQAQVVHAGSPEASNGNGTIRRGFGVQVLDSAQGYPYSLTDQWGIKVDQLTAGKGTNAAMVFVDQAGATGSNYGIWSRTQTASCAAGFVGGQNADVCLYRGAAGSWLIQNPGSTGASLWVSKYSCVGCTSAPANTAVGAFSTTVSNPTLQAFGAVTANAASGLLAFTVNTAAVTCATAVVTNTNVVAASQVQLTIQSYTGTKFTNGFPVVARANTAGSSAGSFTIELCNTHATNALSGNLYVSFWVLN